MLRPTIQCNIAEFLWSDEYRMGAMLGARNSGRWFSDMPHGFWAPVQERFRLTERCSLAGWLTSRNIMRGKVEGVAG